MTSMSSHTSEAGLDFIIIGASISGLASAIALKASGHNVLVLEKEKQLGGSDSIPSGCARVPPNGCKILFDWGLGSKVVENAVVGEGFVLYKYNGEQGTSRDCLGLNRWDPEFLTAARGDFLLFRHKDLLRILYEAAIQPLPRTASAGDTSPKVTVLFGAEVVRINTDAPSVILRSGRVHRGDILIGADGARGIVRNTLLREELEDPTATVDEFDLPTGLSVCSAIVPKAVGITDPELVSLYEYPQSSFGTVSMGSNRAAQTCLVGKSNDIAFWVYTPDESQDGNWTQAAERKMSDVVGPCDPAIQRLGALAGTCTSIQIKDHYELDSWVSQSGRVVVLGEAAHPFPPASLHAYSIALEDGAFMGNIFSHTRIRDRIAEFLYAFEEHRRDRCSRIRDAEKQYIASITLPDGEMQAERDASMRANQAAGRNVMDGPKSHVSRMLDEMRMVFGYEPADDADEWWMSWGRLRNAPAASNGR
ncbi:hypothetical protein B0H19DRAFT_59045 [Mycena capillaripes]|nr:hypothetical protein B0H19DRAFT_59045 [Mycena capillaripes]